MATSARPVAPSKRRGEGQGRTAPQTFDISKVSARGLSFGVPSSGSPGAALILPRDPDAPPGGPGILVSGLLPPLPSSPPG